MRLRQQPGTLLRVALAGDLVLLSWAVAAFALLPLFPTIDGTPNPVTWPEAVLAAGAVLVSVGLVGRIFEAPHVFGNEWSYLAAGGMFLLTWFTFTASAGLAILVSWQQVTVVTLFLWSGVFGAFAAHLVDGGPEPTIGMLRRTSDTAP